MPMGLRERSCLHHCSSCGLRKLIFAALLVAGALSLLRLASFQTALAAVVATAELGSSSNRTSDAVDSSGSSPPLAVVKVSSLEDLGAIDRAIATGSLAVDGRGEAVAIASPVSHGPFEEEVVFATPEWPILHGPELGIVPYKDMFMELNATHGAYSGFVHSVVISRCSARALEKKPFGQQADELWAFRRLYCSEAAATSNAAAFHLVVPLNYPEGGFFGHTIDNVMPRLAVLLPAARLAGHRVSVVFPPDARKHYSKNSELLLDSLGVRVLQEAPPQPHRVVGISGVGAWDRLLRLSFQRQLRAGAFLRNLGPADCAGAAAGRGLFLSRSQGANNGREVKNSTLLEKAMAKRGFEVLTNVGAVPLAGLAARLYSRTCALAGFAGTQLLNLVFLPDGARVIEFDSHDIYEDYWHWAGALGLRYRHVKTPPAIADPKRAAALAEEALAH